MSTPLPGPRLDDLAAARFARRVAKSWLLILSCAVVAAITGFYISSSRTKIYEATTVLQLNDVDVMSLFFGQNLQQPGADAQSKGATNAQLLKLPAVLESASQALGGKPSSSDLASAISVKSSATTTLVELTARNQSPRLAARIANAVRTSFITMKRRDSASQFKDVHQRLAHELARIPKSQNDSETAHLIRDRLQQVEVLRSIASSGVKTVQSARVPSRPISPKPPRDAFLSFLIGGLIGLAAAAIRARLDDRIRDVGELQEIWNLPIVGKIPETKSLRGAGRGIPAGGTAEAFALARTNLRYLHMEGDIRTVVITSALAEEGKSTVTWNLALASALAGSRVLVVDADLRRPVLADRLGLLSQSGLSEILAGMASIEDSVKSIAIETAYGDDPSIDIISAGLIPPSPTALLERDNARGFIETVRTLYDLVIIDTPPATVVADAKILLGYVDGSIVVSRLDNVTRSELARLRDLFADVDTPVLGTIVNADTPSKAYGYGYGYGAYPVIPISGVEDAKSK